MNDREIAELTPRAVAELAPRAVIEGVLSMVGWPMRQCDYEMVMLMWGDHTETLSEHHRLTSLVNVAAEYCWDHILGEPSKPTARQIAKAYLAYLRSSASALRAQHATARRNRVTKKK